MSAATGATPDRSPDTGEVDPRLVDLVWAVAMALAVAVLIAADVTGGGRVGPAAYLFAVGFGALIAVRRLVPRTMLVLTVLGLFGYYALDFPVIGTALPAVAALYSAAEFRRTGWAICGAVVLLVVSSYFRIREGRPLSFLYSYELLTNIALAAAAIALGTAVRLWRDARANAERVRLLTAAEQEQQAERRIQAERVRIARDLHDVIGHQLSVISLHSGVAAEAIGTDDTAARRALDLVREAASTSLHEVRSTVKLLRRPTGEELPSSATGLDGIESLVRPARAAGLRVEVDISVPDGALDTAIDTAAYRIVQESLTNVLRHAAADRARVSAYVQDGSLLLEITDDGRGSAGSAPTEPTSDAAGGRSPGGQGVAGMRERCSLLGGSLEAGDRPAGGYQVTARLPTRLEQ